MGEDESRLIVGVDVMGDERWGFEESYVGRREEAEEMFDDGML